MREVHAQGQVFLRLIGRHAVRHLGYGRHHAGIAQRALCSGLRHCVKQRPRLRQHTLQHVCAEQRRMKRFGAVPTAHATHLRILVPQNRLPRRCAVAAQERDRIAGGQMQGRRMGKVLCRQLRHRRRNQQHLLRALRNTRRMQRVGLRGKRRFTHFAQQCRFPKQLMRKRVRHPCRGVRKQNRARERIHAVAARDAVQENRSNMTH